MGDIFDRVETKGDVFDQVASAIAQSPSAPTPAPTGQLGVQAGILGGTPKPSIADLISRGSAADTSIGRGAEGFIEAVNPIPLIKRLSQAAKMGPEQAPTEIARSLIEPIASQTAENVNNAANALGNADYPNALKYSAQSIPLAGPILQNILSKVHEGNIAGAIGYGAGIAAPTVGAKALEVGNAIPEALNKSAVDQYSRVLNPTTVANKAITQEVVPQLIKRGVKSATFKGLQEQIGTNAANSLAKLEDVWDTQLAGKTIDKSKLLDAMDDALDQWKTQGEKQVHTGQMDANGNPIMKTVPTTVEPRPEINGALRGIRNIIDDYGNDISVETLRKTRQMWDSVVAKAGGFAGADLINQAKLYAQREGSNAIRTALAKSDPDLAVANKEISFWLRVQDVMDATELRRMGQATPISEKILAMGGLAHSGVLGGLAVAGAAKIFRSTGYRTTMAIAKSRLADLIASGDITKANALISATLGEEQK